MSAQAYPLHWPGHIPRFSPREKGAFKSSLPAALGNVRDSLRRFAQDSGKDIEHLVISSNVTLGEQRPDDPGVAVWFSWDGISVCIPVDRYSTVEANLQAIHHVLEARRTEMRHGTLALVRASFSGFVALPDMTSTSWWVVLGVAQDASRAEVQAAYKLARGVTHPDRPSGSAEAFARVTEAWTNYERTRA